MSDPFRCTRCGGLSAEATRCPACGARTFCLARSEVTGRTTLRAPGRLLSLQAARERRQARTRD